MLWRIEMADDFPRRRSRCSEGRAAPQVPLVVVSRVLIPLVAVVIGGRLAVKAIMARGPTITITFRNAEGLE
jgi:paraquat-inducible protein B